MNKIPTAREFLDSKVFNKTPEEIQIIMIEFAKLNVEAALEASANQYYPRDKENFELIAEKFLNAYPLTNIK
jgi:hypothetical protein